MSKPEITALYRDAIQLETDLQLSRAAALYEQLVESCDPAMAWETVKGAKQGLRRIEKFRATFGLGEADLHQRLAKTFVDYCPSELARREECGWIDVRYPDGKKGYSTLNPYNLCFRSAELRRRNERMAEPDRAFAGFFLDQVAEIERIRETAGAPARYVNPQACVLSMEAEIKQTDLPLGRTVRTWFPFPLLCPSTQDIRILSVQPADALQSFPDIEAEVGVAYLEMPRPQETALRIEVTVAFISYQTDVAIASVEIPPYDEESDLYRRFTRSEQHIRLTESVKELALSIVDGARNPYGKARKLYDWFCDNIHYNGIWAWRESLFSPYGCASEDVRTRRVGDCVTQSHFYAALCRSVGVPARVCGGFMFQPGVQNDHFWAEVYFPTYGWMPVDAAFAEGMCLAPGLTASQKGSLRDFFFGGLDLYRLRTHRSGVAQSLEPVKRSPRRRQAFFTSPEFECGGEDVEVCRFAWTCRAR